MLGERRSSWCIFGPAIARRDKAKRKIFSFMPSKPTRVVLEDKKSKHGASKRHLLSNELLLSAITSPSSLVFQEVIKFSKHILCKFFELLPNNPVLLAELVVWKSAGACYEIAEGYGTLAVK